MAKKLWGGRFTKKTDPLVEEFTKSVQYDHKLAKYDLFGSIAQARILKRAGVLTNKEEAKLVKALKAILKSVEKGVFKPDMDVEDIHTQIQNALEKKTGELALKIHTARSRNDQVVFATKMYCKVEIAKLQSDIMHLVLSLFSLAKHNRDLILPGFTHMQHAQPVALKDYLSAYAEMLKRDANRLNFIFKNLKLTMGAGALAGTPIDASFYHVKASEYTDLKGLAGVFDIEAGVNPLDSVSDRDFVVDILSALSVAGMHMSRLAEDLLLWSTNEFGFIDIDEAYCTGSSLMPQKKNADVLELARGYTGRLYGNLLSVLTMMKGLPLSYNRDMQLDKEPLFNSFETVSMELKILAGLVKTLKFNKKRIGKFLEDESLYATDLVYYLVDLGMPFKKAHAAVGELVKHSIESSTDIKDMSEAELKAKLSKRVSKKEILKRLDPEFSVRSKKSIKRGF